MLVFTRSTPIYEYRAAGQETSTFTRAVRVFEVWIRARWRECGASAGLLTIPDGGGWGLSEHDTERIIKLKLGMGWSNKGNHYSQSKNKEIRRAIEQYYKAKQMREIKYNRARQKQHQPER
jgi:hypothetical protein